MQGKLPGQKREEAAAYALLGEEERREREVAALKLQVGACSIASSPLHSLRVAPRGKLIN